MIRGKGDSGSEMQNRGVLLSHQAFKWLFRPCFIKLHRCDYIGGKIIEIPKPSYPPPTKAIAPPLRSSFEGETNRGNQASSTVIKCLECGNKFASKGNLVVHMRIHNKERPYICRKCSKTFVQVGHVLKHIKSVHGGKGKYDFKPSPTECNGIKTNGRKKSRHKLKQSGHVKKPVTTTPKRLTTSELSKTKKIASHVKNEKRKSPIPSKARSSSLTCRICKKELANFWSLKVHMMIHSGYKPFSCTDCGAKFRQLGHAKKHAWVVHQSTRFNYEGRPYKTKVNRRQKFKTQKVGNGKESKTKENRAIGAPQRLSGSKRNSGGKAPSDVHFKNNSISIVEPDDPKLRDTSKNSLLRPARLNLYNLCIS